MSESDYKLHIRDVADNSFQKAVPINYGAYYRYFTTKYNYNILQY